MARWIIFLTVPFLMIFIPFKWVERTNRLSYVPNGLNVSTIIYAESDSLGFGPGAAEAEVVVYELPEKTAQAIQLVGIKFFSQMPEQMVVDGNLHGHFNGWKPTPIQSDPKWTTRDLNGKVDTKDQKPAVANFLGNYFGFSIDAEIEKEIDKIVSAPGSFFAYGRYGILIVSPAVKKVIFAHNG